MQRARSQLAVVGLTLMLAGASGCGGSNGDGVIQPVSGGFEQSDPRTHQLILVIFEDDSGTIDFVELACAPGGVLAAESRTVGSNVRIDGGAFTVDDEDVSIDGSFVSPTRAEGTIRAKTDKARRCGVPGEGAWAAQRSLDVRSAGPGRYTLTRP